MLSSTQVVAWRPKIESLARANQTRRAPQIARAHRGGGTGRTYFRSASYARDITELILVYSHSLLFFTYKITQLIK